MAKAGKRSYIIGIDVGGTNLKIALFDLRLRLLRRETLATGRFRRKEELIRAICGAVEGIIAHHGIKKSRVCGVGLGLPGPVDPARRLVHFFPNIPGWKEVSLGSLLERKVRLPVRMDNDAKVMALAEHRLGAAKGAGNAICLTLGTGVGSGIIIDGEIYRGRDNAAGEIGHMPINERGPRCNCGGMACLEAYIGNRRIMARARKIFGRAITLEEASLLARKGNAAACSLWKEAGRHLGTALVAAANVFNPERIVIGGGVSEAGRVLFDEVRRTVSARAMRVQAKGLVIAKAKLGSDAGLIGAALLVKEGIGI